MPDGRALAMRTEEVPEQLATYGGAFGTGIVLGWVANTRPTWATGLTLGAAAGGAIGALMTRGFASQMLEGCGSAAMGALGASLPSLFQGGGTAGQRSQPKQLPAPTNVVGAAIGRQAGQSLAI